jgi:hypothetical protein
VKYEYRPEKIIKTLSGAKTVISSFLTRDHVFPNSESQRENAYLITLGSKRGMINGLGVRERERENQGTHSHPGFHGPRCMVPGTIS